MKRKFSLAYLTIPGIEPLEQIRTAAETGYDYVSLRTIPMGQTGEPQICLEKDPELFQKIRRTLKSEGMKLLDIELVRIQDGPTPDYRRAFECGAELGASDILSSIWTGDFNLAVEQCGSVCEQAREFGMNVNLEFPIVSAMTTLERTAAVQDLVGAPNLKILMDMIYCHWSGVTGEQIRQMDPNRFGLIHLCDCPKNAEGIETMRIVREAREYCGLGAAALKDILDALPENPCSIELPNLKYIESCGAAGHAAQCLEYAKRFFAEACLK